MSPTISPSYISVEEAPWPAQFVHRVVVVVGSEDGLLEARRVGGEAAHALAYELPECTRPDRDPDDVVQLGALPLLVQPVYWWCHPLSRSAGIEQLPGPSAWMLPLQMSSLGISPKT